MELPSENICFARRQSGGFPVRLNPRATFEDLELYLKPEERIILHSAEITGCTNQEGKEFSTERLMDRLQQWQDLPVAFPDGKMGREPS